MALLMVATTLYSIPVNSVHAVGKGTNCSEIAKTLAQDETPGGGDVASELAKGDGLKDEVGIYC